MSSKAFSFPYSATTQSSLLQMDVQSVQLVFLSSVLHCGNFACNWPLVMFSKEDSTHKAATSQITPYILPAAMLYNCKFALVG